MVKKLLDFKANISEVKQINPHFSTCKVRVLYVGKNRNMSIITKEAVEKALPSIKNIPIVGEFSVENDDYKGHGGAMSLDDYRFIHTTKPYGVVPESATYEWEEIRSVDGVTREYLTINDCYLWTGRYEEAFSVVRDGKGQSMEIEVTDGKWLEDEEIYQIDNFIFSALCILGDDVEPAFEDANIATYSLDKDSFKKDFSLMLSELNTSLSKEKEVNQMIKELLKKYSLTIEDLTSKGIDLNNIAEDELEAKIIEVFEIDNTSNNEDQGGGTTDDQCKCEDECTCYADNSKDDSKKHDEDLSGGNKDDAPLNNEANDESQDSQKIIEELEFKVKELEDSLKSINDELGSLRQYKLDTERAAHEEAAAKLFSNFQLSSEDIKDLDIHSLSIEEIEDKCFAIIGRKLASKKNFSKSKEPINIRFDSEDEDDDQDEKNVPYGGLLEKYNNNN